MIARHKFSRIVLGLLLTTSAFGQAPEKMSYQAVVRDASNAIVENQAVGMQISILQGSTTGSPVYVETQTPSTNANGLVSLEIGTGTTTDNFSTIDWTNGPYFIKTETDPTGGVSYTIIGTSQLMSVPYALYAKTSGSSTPGPQGATGQQGPAGANGADGADGIGVAQTLSQSGNTIALSDGGGSVSITDNDTQLTEAEVDGFADNNGYLTSEVDGDATNEIQDLQLIGNSLTITNNASPTAIDLSPFAGTNTDNQTVSLSGADLSITGGNTIDISSIDTDTQLSDAEITAFGYIKDGTDADADATNEIQDISTDGTAGDLTLSSGSTLTLNVDDADADPTNENQTVSASTGISINQMGQDFAVTNTSPDQTVALADGGNGNVTIGGAYPSFTIDVPDNLDNNATNEIQDISTDGTAGDLTLSNGSTLTLNVADGDADDTNEIELPTQTGQSGRYLSTNGTSPNWADLTSSQWTTNGTSINYTSGNINIGSGTIPSSRLQLSTSAVGSTTSQLTLSESNTTSDASMTFNNAGNAYTIGVDGTDDYFKISDATALGNNNRLIIDNLGSIGVGITPNAQFHVQTSAFESTAVRITNNNDGAGSKIGVFNELDNQGSSIKAGVWNDIDGTSASTQQIKGIYNIINPTDGATYGVHTQINTAGTGFRFGTYADVRGASGNTSNIYGFFSRMDHDGSGDSFGFLASMIGSTSGRKYGIYTNGENYNYFEGNVGIGEVEPDVKLFIESFTLNSTLPLVRLNAPSDAGISYNIAGGNEFVVGVDATDNSFKISDGPSLGIGQRFIVNPTGNIGISQPAPSARLDVVGTTELNGAVDIQGTVDITGLLTVTNDVAIPEANDYTYSSAKTRQMSYHPTEFQLLRINGIDTELVTTNAVNLYTFYSGGGTGLAYATAPIKLPDGAVITELDAWIVDNDAGDFVRVQMQRSSIGVSNSNQLMASVATDAATMSSTVAQLNDNTIFSSMIDNSDYSYRLLFTASTSNSAELQLHGVRITYQVLQVD